MPEHLADVPEFKGNVLVRKVGEKEDVISEKEEDKMLQKVDQELGNGKDCFLLQWFFSWKEFGIAEEE